jgi:hypothetical protein
MAAGLLLTYIQLPDDGRPPDWAAGHRAIDTLTFADLDAQLLDALDAQLANLPVDDDQSYEAAVVDAARRRLHRRLDELWEVHGTGALGPDVLECTLFGHRLLVAGGISLGGPPSDLFDAINELVEFPRITHALGCDRDLRPPAAEPSGVSSELLDELERQLQERGVRSENLDDLVHDMASHNASAINNGGLRDQLAFLVEQLGEQGLRAELGIAG